MFTLGIRVEWSCDVVFDDGFVLSVFYIADRYLRGNWCVHNTYVFHLVFASVFMCIVCTGEVGFCRIFCIWICMTAVYDISCIVSIASGHSERFCYFFCARCAHQNRARFIGCIFRCRNAFRMIRLFVHHGIVNEVTPLYQFLYFSRSFSRASVSISHSN